MNGIGERRGSVGKADSRASAAATAAAASCCWRPPCEGGQQRWESGQGGIHLHPPPLIALPCCQLAQARSLGGGERQHCCQLCQQCRGWRGRRQRQWRQRHPATATATATAALLQAHAQGVCIQPSHPGLLLTLTAHATPTATSSSSCCCHATAGCLRHPGQGSVLPQHPPQLLGELPSQHPQQAGSPPLHHPCAQREGEVAAAAAASAHCLLSPGVPHHTAPLACTG